MNPFSAYSSTYSPPPGLITQHGMDLFFQIEPSQNYLVAADWGHDSGGFFGCGNDNQLGFQTTNIQLVT